MTKRDRIKMKYGGLCAYSGTPLEDDWQIDHIEPIRRDWWQNSMIHKERDNELNMVPCQKIINHYKHSYTLEQFRTWLLGGLHDRLRNLPKNTKVEKTKKRKEYLKKVADYFGITEDKPFSGKFYFETNKT